MIGWQLVFGFRLKKSQTRLQELFRLKKSQTRLQELFRLKKKSNKIARIVHTCYYDVA